MSFVFSLDDKRQVHHSRNYEKTTVIYPTFFLPTITSKFSVHSPRSIFRQNYFSMSNKTIIRSFATHNSNPRRVRHLHQAPYHHHHYYRRLFHSNVPSGLVLSSSSSSSCVHFSRSHVSSFPPVLNGPVWRPPD